MEDKQEQKFHHLTEDPVSSLICRLALPCIISMLVTAFYNMADTFFVGMLNSNPATGAVGVVFSLMAIIQAVGFFFGHGSGNFISRELGKQHTETASNMAATGFFAALATGLVICILGQIFLTPLANFLGSTPTILPYARDYMRVILFGAPWMTASLVLNNQLRFQGSAVYGMVGIVSGAVLNIGLDPLLIFVFDMGIAGAAWATIFSQFVSFCLLLVGCTRGGNLHIHISRVQLKPSYYLMILKGGLPSLARQGPPANLSHHLPQLGRPALWRCRHRRHGCGPADHDVRRLGHDRLRSGLPAGVRLQLRGKALPPGAGGVPLLLPQLHCLSDGRGRPGICFRAPDRGGVPG